MKQYLELIENALNEETFNYDETKVQPALMTLSEYLSHRNPRNKMHPDSAYDFDLESLNQNYSVGLNREGGITIFGGERFEKYTNDKEGDSLIVVVKSEKKNTVALVKDGVLYYDPIQIKKDHAISVTNSDYYGFETQPVKYLEPVYKSLFVKSTKNEYDELIKRLNVDGEYLEIRKRNDEFGDVAAFNEDDMKVAVAQDEWGAVLVSVAQEYRGKGIGRVLQKIYTDMYPDKESGGFTPSGLNNARKAWELEVKRFLSAGIYSNLIRKGKITKERVDKILADVSGKVDFKANLPKKVPQKQKNYLVYYNGSNSFVLYDAEYLVDQDDKYIYGYIHFSQEQRTDTIFVYRFEYENDKDRKSLLTLSLQQLQNEDVKVNAEFEGTDYFKYEDIKYISVNDKGFFEVQGKPFSNPQMIFNKEKQLRKQIDKYNEVLYQLLEDADSKWK